MDNQSQGCVCLNTLACVVIQRVHIPIKEAKYNEGMKPHLNWIITSQQYTVAIKPGILACFQLSFLLPSPRPWSSLGHLPLSLTLPHNNCDRVWLLLVYPTPLLPNTLPVSAGWPHFRRQAGVPQSVSLGRLQYNTLKRRQTNWLRTS